MWAGTTLFAKEYFRREREGLARYWLFVILTLVTKPTSCWHCKYYDHGYCSLHKKEVKGNDTPCDDGEIEMNYGNPYSF